MALRPFHILVAGHGELAAALVSAAEMICGALPGVGAIGLRANETPEAFERRLRAQLEPERPTLILTDLRGGTPHNVASMVARRDDRLWVIGGANLGLLIEATTSRDELDAAHVERLVKVARNAIADASARLEARH